MQDIKNELQYIILGDGPAGGPGILKKIQFSVEQMRDLVLYLKNSSTSKAKKEQRPLGTLHTQ